MENVLVGHKKRHLPIPEGYRLIIDNTKMQKGDLVANLYDVKWETIDRDDIGQVKFYDFVIRKQAA